VLADNVAGSLRVNRLVWEQNWCNHFVIKSHIIYHFAAPKRVECVVGLGIYTFRNQVTAIVGFAGGPQMREGFRKRLTNLCDVGAVAGCSVVSHTVGVTSIHVAAVEHVALQLAVLAELVLAKTVPGHNPALL